MPGPQAWKGIAMNHQTAKPGRLPYLFALVIFVVGVYIGADHISRGMRGIRGSAEDLDLPRSKHRMAVPGKRDLTFTEPGDYAIFYEYQTTFNKRSYSTGEDFPDLEYTFTHKQSGDPVALTPCFATESYTINDRSGRSVFVFELDRPGVYEFSAKYPKARHGPGIVLAFRDGSILKMLDSTAVFLRGIGIATAAFIISAIVALRTLVKRKAAKQKSRKRPSPTPIYP